MLEKIVTLENVSLVDFLGIENQNINMLSMGFPDSKIVSKGNKIIIKGSASKIFKINEIINSLLSHYHEYGKVVVENVKDILANEQTIITGKEHTSVLLHGTKSIRIVPKTVNQKKMVAEAEKNDMVFASGPAGTGKTYIAVALAVRALKYKEVKKIIITRPVVEAGESLGFLPGDLKEKVDPYLRPIYDALNDMIPAEKLRYYKENGIIEIAPLAYMRGRTLHNAYVILDEAQNTTSMQMKMFLTRMGSESKVIITGDRSQIDLPKKQISGLIEVVEILKNVRGIGFVELDSRDVVRHELVKTIVKAYKDYGLQGNKSDQ